MNNKKSKIGCFFGTFNPIHNGHMMMANYVLEHTDICRVIFVISPNSPFKEHTGDLLDFHNTKMVMRYVISISVKNVMALLTVMSRKINVVLSLKIIVSQLLMKNIWYNQSCIILLTQKALCIRHSKVRIGNGINTAK